MSKGEIFHNYETSKQVMSEHAGASAFYKNAAGEIFHTYSCYARGLDALNGAYHWLDRMPKGRDEEGLAFSQAWVRYHDRYDTDYKVDPSAGYQPPGGAR